MSEIIVENESTEYSEGNTQDDATDSRAAYVIVTAILAVIALGLFLVLMFPLALFADNTILNIIIWTFVVALLVSCLNRVIAIAVSDATGKTYDEAYNMVWRRCLSIAIAFLWGVLVSYCLYNILVG